MRAGYRIGNVPTPLQWNSAIIEGISCQNQFHFVFGILAKFIQTGRVITKLWNVINFVRIGGNISSHSTHTVVSPREKDRVSFDFKLFTRKPTLDVCPSLGHRRIQAKLKRVNGAEKINLSTDRNFWLHSGFEMLPMFLKAWTRAHGLYWDMGILAYRVSTKEWPPKISSMNTGSF